MKKSLWIMAAAALVLSACSKNEIGVPAEPTWQLNMTGGAPVTKTSIGVPDEEGSVPFLWKSGDKMGLFVFNGSTVVTGNDNIVALVQTGSEKGPGYNRGDFSATLTSLEANTTYSVRMYYPYSYSAGTEGSTVSHSIPALQTQKGGSISEHLGMSGAFGYATAGFTTPADITDYEPSLSFELTQKTAVLWLNLRAADSALNGWKVRSVKISAPEGTYLTGNTSFNTSSGSFTIASLGSNSVTVNIPAGVTLATGVSTAVYAVVFPASVDGKKLTFTYTVESADASQTKVVTHTRTIPDGMGVFEPASVNRFAENIPSADASGWVYSTSRIDLSAGGTANSYIVSAPGSYSLNAMLIGNGEKGLRSSTYFHSSASISPASAELVWQTKAGLITDVALSDGNLIFTKPDAQEGNALVCVKDAGGDILWSWHIWCTDMPVPQTYITPNNTYEVMDRHLGATHASSTTVSDAALQKECLGLYYQWGRKDPFVGPAELPAASADADAMATLYSADGSVFTRPEPVAATTTNSTQQAVAATPALFLTYNGDWHRPARVRNFWGNTPGSDYVTVPSTPEKTIYDPCPPGWMVCPNDMFNAFTKCSGSVSKQGHLITYDGTHNTWVPRQGCMSSSTGLMNTYAGASGSMGYIWKSDFASATGTNPNMSRMQYSTSSTRGGTDNVNQLPAANGMNVRCIQELK